VLLTAGILVLAYGLGFALPRLRAIIFERGWMQFAIVGLSAWCGALLAAKLRYVRRESAAVRPELLAAEPLSPDQVPDFLAAVDARLQSCGVADPQQRLFPKRLSLALGRFKVFGSAPGVADYVRQQSEADLAAMDSSYATLRLLLWAIPVLGFIGTVVAIGSAVSGFAGLIGNAQAIEQFSGNMKDALGVVSSGLGVAFDATLLALLMSLPAMALTSVVQQREERLHLQIEELLTDQLIPLLGSHDRTTPLWPASGGEYAAPFEALAHAAKGLADSSARLDAQLSSATQLVESLCQVAARSEEEQRILRALGNGYFVKTLGGLQAGMDKLTPAIERLARIHVTFAAE
jgi:hypothetical protein